MSKKKNNNFRDIASTTWYNVRIDRGGDAESVKAQNLQV